MGVGLPGAYESDLCRTVTRTAGGIFGHRLLKILVPVGGVVEMRNNLVQRLGGEIGQQPLEFSERTGGIIEMFRFSDGLEGDGVLDEDEAAPILALFIL